MDNYLYSSYIPYSLDQTLLLLLISSPDFVQRHSRVATNRERRSFISVNSSLVPRQLSRFQCTGIRSLADIEDKDELQRRTNLFLMTANYTVNMSLASHIPFTVLLCYIMHCYRVTRFVDMHMHYLNSSCGYYRIAPNFRESVKNHMNVNIRDKNFVIAT